MQALIEGLSRIPQIVKLRSGVNTEQDAAVGLYEKFGFEMIGTVKKELKIGDQYYDEYLMEKFL